MLICDTHADTLWAMTKPDCPAELDITCDRLMRKGDTRVQALALFVGGSGLRGDDADLIERELKQFDVLKARGFYQIRTIDEAKPDVPNAFLTIEGGEAFGSDAGSVDRFAELGVRAAALVWNNENLLACSAVSGSKARLKPFGREVVRRMNAAHIAVDVSHLNDEGVKELLDISAAPIMASHSCAKALCGHPRNLNDELLRSIFRTGGYVGVNFYAEFLDDSGSADVGRIADHIAHMLDLGGEEHVGLGSDFDGIDKYPVGLRHAGEIYALFDNMARRGFGDKNIYEVAGESFKRYLNAV